MVTSQLSKTCQYEIVVKGYLDQSWESWFEYMSLVCDVDEAGVPVTKMIGPLTDQAELYGMIAKIRDLGLTLLSVNCL